MSDEAWLERAVELARGNVAVGGRPFGALVVRADEVVAEGVNRALVDIDVTAHAELVVLRAACRALGSLSLAGCVLVASAQPCPMCQAAALLAGVDRIVFAGSTEAAAAAGFPVAAVAIELCRPFAERATPVAHVPVAGATEPFEAWLARSSATP